MVKVGKSSPGHLKKGWSTTTMVVVAVVGCGALGSRVAGELAICGHRVRGIIRGIIVAN